MFKFIEKLFFKLSRKTTNISQGRILILTYPDFAKKICSFVKKKKSKAKEISVNSLKYKEVSSDKPTWLSRVNDSLQQSQR